MSGELIFEGIYLYSFFMSCKQYTENRLEYEGDSLYNIKWNGNGYDENGNIIYKLNNGNGKIKHYDNGGNLLYEGDISNGKANGKGKEYNNNQLIYYGEFLNGKRWNEIGKAKNDDSDSDSDSDDDELFFFEYTNEKKYPIEI